MLLSLSFVLNAILLWYANESPAVPEYEPTSSRYFVCSSPMLNLPYLAYTLTPFQSSSSTRRVLGLAAVSLWILSFPNQNSAVNWPKPDLYIVIPAAIEVYRAIFSSLKHGPTSTISAHVTIYIKGSSSIRIYGVYSIPSKAWLQEIRAILEGKNEKCSIKQRWFLKYLFITEETKKRVNEWNESPHKLEVNKKLQSQLQLWE